MNVHALLRHKITSALAEGTAHRSRMAYAAKRLAPHLPLSADTLHGLDDESVAALDQFIYRFTKLQDAMGTRLFPAMAAAISGNDASRPFLDILNLLEKFGVIESAETWQTLRVLRNSLAHEYPDNAEQCAATLNILASDWRRLERMFESARTYCEERLLPMMPSGENPPM